MRLPGFDGMIAERGPIHLVSDMGGIPLNCCPTRYARRRGKLALECEETFAPYIGRDLHMSGKFRAILWNANFLNVNDNYSSTNAFNS